MAGGAGWLLICGVPAYERKDAAYRRAKQEGYRSRAAYKLIELADHFALLRPGQRVVDLGCWPGAWTQVASERVGPQGRVVGIDLVPTEDLGLKNVLTLVGDATSEAALAEVARALAGPADVVVADLAPKLSGVSAADAARHAELVEAAVTGARAWLAADGALLVKLFMDAEYPGLIGRLRGAFRSVKTRRPGSTRRGSSEIYACAKGLR